MHLPQHKSCTRKTVPTLEVKFCVDFHWVHMAMVKKWNDVICVFPRCLLFQLRVRRTDDNPSFRVYVFSPYFQPTSIFFPLFPTHLYLQPPISNPPLSSPEVWLHPRVTCADQMTSLNFLHHPSKPWLRPFPRGALSACSESSPAEEKASRVDQLTSHNIWYNDIIYTTLVSSSVSLQFHLTFRGMAAASFLERERCHALRRNSMKLTLFARLYAWSFQRIFAHDNCSVWTNCRLLKFVPVKCVCRGSALHIFCTPTTPGIVAITQCGYTEHFVAQVVATFRVGPILSRFNFPREATWEQMCDFAKICGMVTRLLGIARSDKSTVANKGGEMT